LPAAAYLDGEYAMKGIYLGVPVRLGAGGIEQIIEIDLMPDETEALRRSGDAVASSIRELGV
jgi:malate dehydrogenase